ncbi:MAG: hypothetical protein ACPGVX_04505, partial [Thalassobaculaceae bacterium]
MLLKLFSEIDAESYAMGWTKVKICYIIPLQISAIRIERFPPMRRLPLRHFLPLAIALIGAAPAAADAPPVLASIKPVHSLVARV